MKSNLGYFVVLTLAIEVVLATLYSSLELEADGTTAFYLIMSILALLRAQWVMKRIKASAAAIAFCLVMISTVFLTTVMAIITGLTALAISNKLYYMLDYGLASTYNWLYDTYPIGAAALTVAELLVLLLNQTGRRRRGMENCLFNIGGHLGILSGNNSFTAAKKVIIK